MTQLTKQLTQSSAVAPSHRAPLPELELAAAGAAGKRVGGVSFGLSAGTREEADPEGLG